MGPDEGDFYLASAAAGSAFRKSHDLSHGRGRDMMLACQMSTSNQVAFSFQFDQVCLFGGTCVVAESRGLVHRRDRVLVRP